MPRSRSNSIGSQSRSPSRNRSRSPVKRRTDEDVVNTPFLIRIYISKGRHTPLSQFDNGQFPLRDEFQVYGWKTSTPTSLVRLLLPTLPAPYRSPQSRFSFKHIYVDASQRGLYRSKDLISFTGRELFASSSSSTSGIGMDIDDHAHGKNSNGRGKDEKTLDDYGFITGDLLSVAIHVPEPKGLAIAGAGASASAGAGGAGGLVINGRAGAGAGGLRGDRERDKPPHNNVKNGAGEAPSGNWTRGEPLPPQGNGHGNRQRGEGSWRGGAAGSGGGGGGRGGMGIRGQGRRSPDLTLGRRSRSPESRDKRESWGRRRD